MLTGMLADACDECLVLTRFFDREAFRLEEMVEQIEVLPGKTSLALRRARLLEHWLHTFGFDASAQREVGATSWKSPLPCWRTR